MKELRLLGIDDSIVDFSSPYTDIIGVIMRVGGYIEGVLWDRVSVDGDDSTMVIGEMVNQSRFKEQIHVIFLDGAAVGGFNVVDIFKLNSEVGIPVITFSLKEPSLNDMERALRGKVRNWEKKLHILKTRKLHVMEITDRKVYVSLAGIEKGEAEEVLKASIVRGYTPEPLRVAHIFASALGKGESTSR